MISKEFRLQEKQVQKVLRKGKPFFSYKIVSNSFTNEYTHNRFALVLGGKTVHTAVLRNMFRRKFYDTVSKYISLPPKNGFADIVFVARKGNIFTKQYISEFIQEVHFLLKKQSK